MMAGLQISIRSDLDDLRAQLDDFARKQLPFAVAGVLTEIARGGQKKASALIRAKFDRPTPFSQRGPKVEPATKTFWQSKLYMQEIQAKYLGLEETGGIRTPPKVALVIPVGVKLNKYGNMREGALQGLKDKRNIFVGSVTTKSGHVIGGFWQRMPGNHLKLLAAFKPEAKYLPKFGYSSRIVQEINRDVPLLLRAALSTALRTAKRGTRGFK